MDMIWAFVLAWVSTLSGVALGGFLVFRTKREGYDPLFRATAPEGEAFHIPDAMAMDDPPSTTVEFPREFQEAQDRFAEQFAQTLAEKAGEK